MAALATAFGISARPDWRRIIEEAIMRRRISGLHEALDSLARATGSPAPRGEERRDLTLMWGSACNANRLYPDVLPALDRLSRPGASPVGAGLRLGLISNTQSFDLDILRRERLDVRFMAIVLSCDEGVLKPDGAMFERAAARLGVDPAEALMVGDSLEEDVRGAIAAGMRAVHLRRGGASTPLRGRLDAASADAPVITGLAGLHAVLGTADGPITP